MADKQQQRLLLSGNQAVALAAYHLEVALGVGYPGTPSTEILENFSRYGGRAEWAPNEKVALEVGVGAAYGQARTLVTMKHVGVNVAADPLFTCAYTGVDGGLVLISADDPGMASSQNEQDNRHYAVAAGLPMLEPADSQEAYEFTRLGFELSERWQLPVILRMTTRVCHSQSVVEISDSTTPAKAPQPGYKRDIQRRVMIPAFARTAHRKLRRKLREISQFNEQAKLFQTFAGSRELGIITSGVCFQHVHEAVPEAAILKLGLTYPLPMEAIADFISKVDRCLVIEEGDPYLVDAIRAAGLRPEGKPEMYRFGELNVERVRRIVAGDQTPEPQPAAGKPPQLCQGCPHRQAFTMLRDLGCIVTGDIGCYTLGVLPPFEAIDTCLCMGASIGVGLGLRQVLPEAEARKVVSVIGDSTFVHSGITGLVEMAYNRPATGHTVLILDNDTTAMTGLQEHPGTGRKLDYSPARKLDFVALCKAIGIDQVVVLDPVREQQKMHDTLKTALNGNQLNVIIIRKPCILGIKKARKMKEATTTEQPE